LFPFIFIFYYLFIVALGWFAAEDIKEGEVIWFMESWLDDKVPPSL
jgi:hypothetical protein